VSAQIPSFDVARSLNEPPSFIHGVKSMPVRFTPEH